MAIGEVICCFEKARNIYPENWNFNSDLDYAHLFFSVEDNNLSIDDKVNFVFDLLSSLKEDNIVVIDFYYVSIISKKKIDNFFSCKKITYKYHFKRNIFSFLKKPRLLSFKIDNKEDFSNFIKLFAIYEDNLFIRILDKESKYIFPNIFKNTPELYLKNSQDAIMTFFLSFFKTN